MGDVQIEGIFKTMHQSLAEVKAETPGDTLHDAKTEALSGTLADSLAEVKAKKVGET